jgi:mannose-6-phosphate isomerase
MSQSESPVDYPLCFKPLFQERIWGGRALETVYGKPLPPGKLIGESWEISDRDDAASEVANGPLAGKTLRWITENHRAALLGKARDSRGKYPLLVKILDAREKLSLQVHPPASKARALKGEPKTEMWHIAQAAEGAELYAGLKKGVSREEFTQKIGQGAVEECFHRLPAQAGDTMFLPSGRVHAIGAGLVIFEIQQNSDTTYRVFDWNRTDASGKARELHIDQSLESIDFNDYEPGLTPRMASSLPAKVNAQPLGEDDLFKVELVETAGEARIDYSVWHSRVVACLKGEIEIQHPSIPATLKPGQFCLVPAQMQRAVIAAKTESSFLVAEPG